MIEQTYSYFCDANDNNVPGVQCDVIDTVVDSVNDAVVATTKYLYDENGNIISVVTDYPASSGIAQERISYNYDKWNRLIREDNNKLDRTVLYDYDDNGNILRKHICRYLTPSDAGNPYTTEGIYSYDNVPDRLSSFEGNYCEYDALSNPIIYRGNLVTWTKARRMASFGEGSTFEYNAQGLRTRKNNKTYVLGGDKILKETDGTNTISYYYGGSGVIGFNYNGTDYYYRKNILGDVLDIYTTGGTKVASYVYDAWGNHEITLDINNIGSINPIRYRGYYFDVETGLYYLQTRYYDPETGRFINADQQLNPELFGYNMYAYCNNNPVMKKDITGKGWIGAFIGGVCGLFIGGFFGALSAYTSGKDIIEGAVAGAINATICGAVSGSIAEDIATGGISSIGTATMVGAAAICFSAGVATDITTQVCNSTPIEEIDYSSALRTGAENVIISAVSLGGVALGPLGKVGDVALNSIYNLFTSTIQWITHVLEDSIKQRNKRGISTDETIPME